MKAVVFGPGRIGAGFMGTVLRRAGFEVCFVGRSGSVVSALAERSRYQVRVVWYEEEERYTVAGVTALPATEPVPVVKAIRDADLVVTAVGSSRLPEVAPLLAAGLTGRRQPVPVLVCENLVDPGAELERAVTDATGTAERLASFTGVLVCHAVTHRLAGGEGEPLIFVSEPPLPFHVDGRRLVLPLPDLAGMNIISDFGAAVRKKLYTYSAGHAATAYLGHLKGYHFIHTAICDAEISRIVGEAIGEGQRGIAARYGIDASGGPRERAQIITRFGNPGLADPITRVGREPGRKLGSEDRLVGAARLAERAGIVPAHLALAAAAALCFANPSDPTSLSLLAEIETAGLGHCLSRVCGLQPDRGLGMLLGERWRELSRGWQPGNLLLSIDRLLWATETGNRR